MSHRARALTLLCALVGFPMGCSRCDRTPAAAKTPARDTLAVGLAHPVRTFDPRFALAQRERRVMPLVHCSLFHTNAEGVLVPELAAALPQWINTTTVTMALRRDVSFNDGTPVTARDVKATYDFHRRASLPGIQKIDVTDSNRITFTLSKPDEAFLKNLTLGIVPVSLAATTAPLPPERILGCGPYTLVTQDANGFALQSQTRYALGEAPRMARLQFTIIADEAKRLARLRQRKLDVVADISDFSLVKAMLAKDPSFHVQRRPADAITSLGFNVRDPILSQRAVRRAIAHAVDRLPVINVVFAGFATPVHTVLGLPHDLSRATTLLDAAGYKKRADKPRFTVTLQVPMDVTPLQEAKALAAQLEKVGIHVSVEARADMLPPQHPRTQLWLTKAPLSESQPLATADLALLGLWREDVLIVQDKSLKGFVIHPNGSLASLAATYRSPPR